MPTAAAALQPGGFLLSAAFAPDGPTQCSERPVQRWSADELATLAAGDFTLQTAVPHRHQTPSGAVQSFIYTLLRRR